MELLTGHLTITDLDTVLSRFDSIAATHGVTIQAFDARYVAGRRHLERAVTLAARSFARNENVADDPGVEILLFAAGRRQIDRALEMGISTGEQDVVVLVVDTDELCGESLVGDGVNAVDTGGATGLTEADGVADEAAIAATATDKAIDALQCAFDGLMHVSGDEALSIDGDVETIRRFFDVTADEREATNASLEALVCERVALLEVRK